MKQSRETYELLILVESSHSKQHLSIDRLINAENILSTASSDYAIFYVIWTLFEHVIDLYVQETTRTDHLTDFSWTSYQWTK